MRSLDVLIVDNERDPHSEAVVDELSLFEITAVRFNLADLRLSSIRVEQGNVSFVTGGSRYCITSRTTVWWRRQGVVDTSNLEGEDAQLAQDEGPHILKGALQSVGVRWIDDPGVVSRAELKLFQLQVASNLGIRVPRSLVTSDTDAANEFAIAGPIVAKPLSPGIGIAPYTDQVEDNDLALVSELPVLLQGRVNANADLRVVVVGQDGWVWRRERSSSTLDWRQQDPSGEGFRVFTDEDLVRYACQITSALGLSMSVQDWLETDGEPVFLESNTQGNWIFLEGSHELVAPAVARLLAQQTVSDDGHWPSLWKRILNDFKSKKRAPSQDGIRPPTVRDPLWIEEVAARAEAIEVARRANDKAELGATVAEEKANRLVRRTLTILTVAFLLGGFHLRTVVAESPAWLLMLVPVSIAIVCLFVSVLQSLQIDRVGFYFHPNAKSLARLEVKDVHGQIISDEERGRYWADWSSRKKHSDLMQARAWFTRGLVLLILAAIFALASWWLLADTSSLP